jgi:hypothetical protein
MAPSVLVPVRYGPTFAVPGIMAVAGPMAGTPVRGAMYLPPPRGVTFPSGSSATPRPPTPGSTALAQRLSARAPAQRDGANNVPFPLRLHADLRPTSLVATVVSLETDAGGVERIVERQVTVTPSATGEPVVEVPANAVTLALTSRNGPVPLPWTALVNEWRPLPGTSPADPNAPATAATLDPASPARLSDEFVRQAAASGTFLQRHGGKLLVGGLAAALVAGVVIYSRRKGAAAADDDGPRDNPGCGCGPSCGCGPCREKHHGKAKR